MRRSKSYEVRDPMNIWNKYDFAMSGLGKKSKILAKIKHFFKCVKWSKQRITRGYCDRDVWEMFSFLQTLIPDMLQTLKDTRTGSPGYLGENYTNENGILVNDTCHEEWNCILDKMIFLWREAEHKSEHRMTPKTLENSHFWQKGSTFMARPSLAEKDILNPSEAIEYFVLSRRKFYDLLSNTDGEDFLAYYGERKLILRVAFERYLHNHPELRRWV